MSKTINLTSGRPVPIRFSRGEDQLLIAAANETGMSVSEIVRRSVRLMHKQRIAARNYSFMIDLAANSLATSSAT